MIRVGNAKQAETVHNVEQGGHAYAHAFSATNVFKRNYPKNESTQNEHAFSNLKQRVALAGWQQEQVFLVHYERIEVCCRHVA